MSWCPVVVVDRVRGIWGLRPRDEKIVLCLNKIIVLYALSVTQPPSLPGPDSVLAKRRRLLRKCYNNISTYTSLAGRFTPQANNRSARKVLRHTCSIQGARPDCCCFWVGMSWDWLNRWGRMVTNFTECTQFACKSLFNWTTISTATDNDSEKGKVRV